MFLLRGLRKFKWIIEKSMCYTLVFVITPYFFIFEMVVVRPIIVTTYEFSTMKHAFHILLSMFFFINIVGNMILGIFTDTTIKMRARSHNCEEFCESCQMYRPAKAWHCKKCNVCILKRDHHCFFFSRCIGLRNQRYYVTYLTYIFISMVYSTYFNFYYVVSKYDEYEIYVSVCRIVNPFLRYLIPEPMGMKDLYVFFLFLNVGLVIWSGGLFVFHTRNVLRGETSHEYKENTRSTFRNNLSAMKKNFINVFGEKWYIALVWPLANSPLPETTEDRGDEY